MSGDSDWGPSFLGDVAASMAGAASFPKPSNNFEGVGSGPATSCTGATLSRPARAPNEFLRLTGVARDGP
jgi:hypothetical protein